MKAVELKIWVEIAEERLASNFGVLERAANGRRGGPDEADSAEPAEQAKGNRTAVLAVVKANAYGHGIRPCAAVLARAGAEWLGVTDAHEGAAVREALLEAGIPLEAQPQVLVMCGTAALAGEAELMVRHGLTATVWEAAQLEALAEAAREARRSGSGLEAAPRVHLEIDTGMTRQGVAPGKALAEVLAALRGWQDSVLLTLDGAFTHFASTEVSHSLQTRAQREQFERGHGADCGVWAQAAMGACWQLFVY